MKQIISTIVLILFCEIAAGQDGLFSLYKDSSDLVDDAKRISEKFSADIQKIEPSLKLDVNVVKNTTSALIYYHKNTINLPLWSEVIPQQKHFFYLMVENENEGKTFFGLLFNGFYLVHEFAHALQDNHEGKIEGSYHNEFFANRVAILWWRGIGKQKELEDCYHFIKKVLDKMPNPVPENVPIDRYFTENYNKVADDPMIYGFMQFKQFIEIYENSNQENFDSFLQHYLFKK